MRCKKCEYRLWNLTSRRCPECGTPFVPSEFEFVPNSVQFCCPHCNQSYYGTDDNGHIEPVEFDCVNCGQHIHMDQMILLPTEGVDEKQTKTEECPWLIRKKVGTVKAWFKTIGMAMVSPMRLMELVPIESSLVSAWWFAIFSNALFIFSCFIFFAFFQTLMIGVFSSFGPATGFGMGTGLLMIGGVIVGYFVAAVIGTIIVIALWGLTTHVTLAITGGTSFSIRRTYQALCYSVGGNACTAIPCCGAYFGWIWWLVSAVLTVKSAQRIHGGRAAFAVLTPPLLILAASIGAYIWFFISMMSPMRAQMMTAMQTSNITQIASALDTYYELHEDTWPDHAIQLLGPNSMLSAWSFATPSMSSATQLADVPIGEETLKDFEMLSKQRQDKAVQAAIDSLPDGTIAHRLGDCVFTYHGIPDPDAASAATLWVVIWVPDPDSNTPPAPTDTIVVGQVDGMTTSFPYSSMQTQLTSQNNLRAQHSLPPLPDPYTVTHDKPAVAPAP